VAKTELTLQLEKEIWGATNKMGVFGCFEVTIGFSGHERVDYMTYDTKGIWRCYEIKVSKSDFHSKAHNTFIGHLNYYVMPEELYEQVKGEIPKNIGVYVNGGCWRNAKKQELTVDEQILKNSMIRSLYRDVEKQIRSNDPFLLDIYSRRINKLEKDLERYREKYYELLNRNESEEESLEG
jgi:hypothetical protein